MKKLVMTAAVLACAASIVSAQTVTSANIVGYNKVTKTANGDLNMVGVSFLSENQTLNELFSADQFSGDLFVAGNSDQVIIWNAGTQAYATYVYYDVSSVYGPTYESYDGWQALADFGSAVYADDTVIPLGQGFWYKAVAGFDWAANRPYTP